MNDLIPNSPISLLMGPSSQILLFSEYVGPSPPKWETNASTGGESSNPGWLFVHQSTCYCCKKATLLWAAGVPDPDAAIITGAATSSSEEPGTFTGGNSPGSQDLHVGILAPSPHQITPDLLHPMDLPADCLIAGDMDSGSKAEMGSWLWKWLWEGRNSTKFALHPLTFRMWVVIPQWG